MHTFLYLVELFMVLAPSALLALFVVMFVMLLILGWRVRKQRRELLDLRRELEAMQASDAPSAGK